jgi:hypothetical protein
MQRYVAEAGANVDTIWAFLETIEEHRTSWPGDFIAAVLFILRCATSVNLVPNQPVILNIPGCT